MNIKLSNAEIDQLMQLFWDAPVWDGNLISKAARTKFKEMGFVWKDENGHNYLTDEGKKYAAPIAHETEIPLWVLAKQRRPFPY